MKPTCAGCRVFKEDPIPGSDSRDWLCMYCRHDITAHPMGERCTCTRHEVYPPDLLASLRLNQERHDALTVSPDAADLSLWRLSRHRT